MEPLILALSSMGLSDVIFIASVEVAKDFPSSVEKFSCFYISLYTFLVRSHVSSQGQGKR